MKWTLKKINDIEDERVRDRLLESWHNPKGQPLNGDLSYWYRIVYNKDINYRKKPFLYESGRGHQGVLSVEPYKSEIYPYYSIKSFKEAKKSAKDIYQLFQTYLKEDDFVGADICRKFLSMGRMRCKYFANKMKKKAPPKTQSKETHLNKIEDKIKGSEIFQTYHHKARDSKKFIVLKEEHKKLKKSFEARLEERLSKID